MKNVDQTPSTRHRVRLSEPAEQRMRRWKDLTEDEQRELLPPSLRQTLGLRFFIYECQYVTADKAATILGVDLDEFRNLRRKYQSQLHRDGKRFLVRDLLNLKVSLWSA